MKNQVDDMKAATDHMTAEKVQYLTASTQLLFFYFFFFVPILVTSILSHLNHGTSSTIENEPPS